MKDCVFCNRLLLRGNKLMDFPCFYVIESEGQLQPGHTLVIPNRHIRSEDEMSTKEWGFYQEANTYAISYIKKTFGADCYSYINAPSSQSVLHLHKHFIPNIGGILKPGDIEKALRKHVYNST